MVSMQSRVRCAAIGVLLGAAGLVATAQKPAVAQTNGTWTPTAGGSWPTASNWTGNQIATGVSGSAAITSSIAGTQTITLDGDRTIGFMRFAGGATASAIHSLQMGTSGTLTLQTSSGSPSIDVASNRSGIIGVALAGSQGLTKTGSGTLVLGGTNTYTGTTSVSLGTLELTTPNSFGASGAGNETVVDGNGPARVRIGGTTSTSESFIISGTGVANTGAITFGSSQSNVNTTGTITSQITLSANASIGALSNNSGTLDRLGPGNAVDNAGFRLTYPGGGSLTVNSPITGAGAFVHAGSGTFSVATANTYSGSTSITGNGTLRLGTGGTAGSLATTSAISLAGAASSFVVDQSDTVTQGVDFSGDPITLVGKFTQAGSGTTILTAANSYTGTTSVSAGTLLINGDQSAANGVVTVAAGATLGGSGTIGGAVTVNGILSPGSSPGVLTAASLVLTGSSTSFFEINTTTRGTGYDGVDITSLSSGLTYGGGLSIAFGNLSAFADNTTFDLFNFTGTATGNFTSVSSTGFYAGAWTLASGIWSLESGGQTLSFTPATGDLLVAVPEPSTIAMALAGTACGGFSMWRRRKRA